MAGSSFSSYPSRWPSDGILGFVPPGCFFCLNWSKHNPKLKLGGSWLEYDYKPRFTGQIFFRWSLGGCWSQNVWTFITVLSVLWLKAKYKYHHQFQWSLAGCWSRSPKTYGCSLPDARFVGEYYLRLRSSFPRRLSQSPAHSHRGGILSILNRWEYIGRQENTDVCYIKKTVVT